MSVSTSTTQVQTGDQSPVRVRIPADLDTPDRVAFGLTIRQLVVVAAFATPACLAWETLAGQVPLAALAAGTAPLAALALALAVGRRDGLPLDAWLLAAITHHRRPRRLSPSGVDDARPSRRNRAGQPGQLPSWAPDQDPPAGRRWRRKRAATMGRVGVLRLPASSIGRDGVIVPSPVGTGSGNGRARGQAAAKAGSAVVLVAARTLTSGLHTPAEQAALLGGYARWLNQLSGPAQVIISSRPVDLPSRALRIARDAAGLPHPALAQAAVDHAEHLLDLCEDGNPRARTVIIACTATSTGGPASTSGRASGGAAAEALRRAERTAAALSGIGAECRILDGGQVAGVLTAALDPFGPAGIWPRAIRTEPITSSVASSVASQVQRDGLLR
jgi:hypothetical protein